MISNEASIDRFTDDSHLKEITVPQTNLTPWEAERKFIEAIKTRPVQPEGRNWQREDLYEQ
ncbi:MAG TPA: hypothetical protein V6D25_25720 [Leptolyngbyaceae cyanobacterium]